MVTTECCCLLFRSCHLQHVLQNVCNDYNNKCMFDVVLSCFYQLKQHNFLQCFNAVVWAQKLQLACNPVKQKPKVVEVVVSCEVA